MLLALGPYPPVPPQVALTESHDMAAALCADGRILTWCTALREPTWPQGWGRPALAAVAAGAAAVGWSGTDLLVAMRDEGGYGEGEEAVGVRLEPPREDAR